MSSAKMPAFAPIHFSPMCSQAVPPAKATSSATPPNRPRPPQPSSQKVPPPPPPPPRRAAATQDQNFVLLVRHGMTDWNAEGRVQGSLDHSRLTTQGRRQARDVGRFLRDLPFDSVYCSPLHRARETFSLLADASQNPTLSRRDPTILRELCEIDLPWQGVLRRDIRRGEQAQLYARYSAAPLSFTHGGRNPVAETTAASRAVWDTLRARGPGVHLVISHNQTMKAMLCSALGLPTELTLWKQTNCSLNVLALRPDGPPVLRLCNGFDSTRPEAVRRRARLRPGFVRVYLHHAAGRPAGLRRETAGQKVSRVYVVGRGPGLSVRGARLSEVHALPRDPASRHSAAAAVLERIRRTHRNDNVVLASTCGDDVCAFVAVVLGMQPADYVRFRSDPGGVSVFDISADAAVGQARPRIECFNAHGFERMNQLRSYMTPFDVTDGAGVG